VYDVIYILKKPNFSMMLKKRGKIINGLGMLFYQGISAYEIWTGVKLPRINLKVFMNLSKIFAA